MFKWFSQNKASSFICDEYLYMSLVGTTTASRICACHYLFFAKSTLARLQIKPLPFTITRFQSCSDLQLKAAWVFITPDFVRVKKERCTGVPGNRGLNGRWNETISVTSYTGVRLRLRVGILTAASFMDAINMYHHLKLTYYTEQ